MLVGVALLLYDFFIGGPVLESRDVIFLEIIDTVSSYIERNFFGFLLFFALIGRLGVGI
jgi:hypothetical protein